MKRMKLIRDFIPGEDFGPVDAASRRLAEQNPGLKIVGVYSPPLGFEKDPAEIAASAMASLPFINTFSDIPHLLRRLSRP